MKEESVVAQYYAERFDELTRVEYVGDKPEESCVMQIYVGSPVYSVSYSPDGKYIASASQDNVCIWDAVNGGLIFGPFGGESYSVTFSNDGKYVASGNDDGTIGIWNAATGESIHGALVGHTGLVYSVAFSPDSKYIVSGSLGGTVQIWDVETGMAIGEPLKGQSDISHSILDFVLFSPSGVYFASTSSIREVENGEYPKLIGEIDVWPFAFSHDSSKIVSGARCGTLAVWDTSEGTILRELSGNGTGDVSSDGGDIQLWDAEDRETLLKLFEGYSPESYAPDGTRFVSGSYDGTIRICNAKGRRIETESNKSNICVMAASVDGMYFVVGSFEGTVAILDAENGEVLKGPFEGHSRMSSLSFSPVPGEYRFTSGSLDGNVRIWELNGESITCYGHTWQVSSVCFSPDGRHVASGSWDGTIRVWDSQSGLLAIYPLRGRSRRIFSICYSSDGTRIVSGSDDKTVRIWDSSNGNLLSVLEGHPDTVYSVAFSRNDPLIISGDNGGTIRVWDVNSHDLVHEFSGSAGQALSLCASPNDSWFTSTNWEGTIFLWNALTGNLFLKTNISCSLNNVAFLPSADPKYIKFASASHDGLIRIWCFDLHSQEPAWNLQDDGWLTGNDGNLLFWVPSDLRSSLINNHCTRILNSQFLTKLILSENQGSRWTTCFRS